MKWHFQRAPTVSDSNGTESLEIEMTEPHDLRVLEFSPMLPKVPSFIGG